MRHESIAGVRPWRRSKLGARICPGQRLIGADQLWRDSGFACVGELAVIATSAMTGSRASG